MIEHRIFDMEPNADLEHEIWASWMQYMFTKGEFTPDGRWIMPAWAVDRWTRLMNVPYSELTEQEKEGDRDQVRKHWTFIRTGVISRNDGTKAFSNEVDKYRVKQATLEELTAQLGELTSVATKMVTELTTRDTNDLDDKEAIDWLRGNIRRNIVRATSILTELWKRSKL
jgi:hypothetical protein